MGEISLEFCPLQPRHYLLSFSVAALFISFIFSQLYRLDPVIFLLRPSFQHSVFNILKSGLAAEYFIVHGYVGGFHGISSLPKAKETGIDSFYFDFIGIFFFDFPGQSTEIASPLSRGPIGKDRNFDHNNSPRFQACM
jgi:hypothetical protein